MKTKDRFEEFTDWGASAGCRVAAFFPEIEQGSPNRDSTAAASLPHSKSRGTKRECL
jgi:hypothetical protein